MDPLGEVLRVSRVRGVLLSSVEARDPWGLGLGAAAQAALHAITHGTCWLRRPGQAAIRLLPGDVVLLPGGAPHELVSTPDGPTVPFDRQAKLDRLDDVGVLAIGGTGDLTRILCAAYDYDHEIAQPLMSALPPVIHVTAGDPTAGLGATLRLLQAELGSAAPGSRTAVDRLVDLLLIHILRAWVDGQRDTPWLAALSDPTTAAALAAIHERPERPWSADSLARAAGVSRATLARRFADLVGQPPLTYLTNWRMDLAARALRETSQPIDLIARRVGYSSEYAFSRAFTRSRGTPPGRYRLATASTRVDESA